MGLTSSRSISRAAAICGLIFVGLNIADAWLTKQLLTSGWQEANPIVNFYGPNILIKGLLALAIVALLVRFGKAKFLPVLNICMLAVVLWLSAGVLGFI